MKKVFLIFAILTVVIPDIKADDRLLLKAGGSVDGYISCQLPGKQIIFQTDDQTIVYDFADVVRIEKSLRDSDMIVGINDVIETRAGNSYKGQITVQELGKWIQINTSNGVKTINSSDIRRQRREVLNPKYSLFEQSKYLDVVQTKSKRVFTGIITLQDYGKDSIGSYLIITDERSGINQINVKDIEQLRRKPNKAYQEIKKIKIKGNEVFFNKTLIPEISTQKDKKDLIYFSEDQIKKQAPLKVKEGKLVIQMKDSPTNRQLILVKIGMMKIGKNRVYAFTYEDLIQNACTPQSSTVEPEDALTNTYHVSAGVYALYHQSTGHVNCCEIVKEDGAK